MAKLSKFNDDAALKKISRYCAFRERCEHEVREKLAQMNVFGSQADKLISKLREEDFLNDERYLRSFVLGKFNQNSWGRNRIHHELTMRGFKDHIASQALAEIPEEAYEMTLDKLAKEKFSSRREEDLFEKRGKVAAYLIRKGFEPDLVWSRLKELFKG